MGRPTRVTVVEVGPRDGLQNESAVVDTAAKIRFVEALADAGLRVVEVTSFVRPDLVPQLADADAVLRGIHRRPGVRYPVLVPNVRGLERALAAGADAIAVFTAASEAFAKANIGMTIEQSLEAFVPVLERARHEGAWRRGYVSTAFGCPYQGAVDAAAVVSVATRLLELGCEEVSIGDTIGVAVPEQVTDVVGRLLDHAPPSASHCTSTTPAAARWTTRRPASTWAFPPSTAPRAASEAARSRPGRRATWRPAICSAARCTGHRARRRRGGGGRRRRRAIPHSVTVTFSMVTSSSGRSPGPVATPSIASTTSIPLVT